MKVWWMRETAINRVSNTFWIFSSYLIANYKMQIVSWINTSNQQSFDFDVKFFRSAANYSKKKSTENEVERSKNLISDNVELFHWF